MIRLRILLPSLMAPYAPGDTAQTQMPLRIYVDAAPLFSLSQAETFQDVSESEVSVDYRLGAGLDASVGKTMYAGTGLSLTMRENQYTILDLMGKSGDIKVYSHYMQVPINVDVHLNVTSRVGCSIGTGPYFAYALGMTVSQGKILDDTQKTYNVHKGDILGMDSAELRRHDIGLGVKVKVASSLWYSMLDADLGFVDELRLEKDDPKIEKLGQKAMRNTSLYLGISFAF